MMRHILIGLMLLGVGLALVAFPAGVQSAATVTHTSTITRTPTQTRTATLTRTSTKTSTSTRTPTATRTPTITRTPTVTRTPTNTRTPTSTRTPTRTRTPTATRTPTQTPLPTLTAARGFAVGDSVMLGAARELQRAMPGLIVDAKVSRHLGVAMEILRQQRKAGTLGEFVIVHIGDNGYIKPGQFDELLELVKEVPRVIVFTLKEPRPWEGSNNKLIAEAVQRHPNAVLVDWRGATIGHPEYFARDGIHIGTVGARVYTALVAEQLRKP